MKAEELLADLRKRAEREDFTETHQADAHGGVRLVQTPYYMLLLPSAVRAALTLAQQEARAERDRAWGELFYGWLAGRHIGNCCARLSGDDPLHGCDHCAPFRALLEGK